jgi:pimeloyl-ACP methyl ester carboxylesterase
MPYALRLLLRIVALFCAGVFGYYVWKNPETTTLDAKAREGAPGRFVTLSHGVTHYEAACPDTARTLVLVHGYSVPYYIWDSTFVALRGAGYRVVRYDLYGRGLSDRPDVAYDGALFDAQLDELLDSLHVTGPVDLMGLSYGGFVTGHYVATHAKRVRTLTLVDPAAEGRSVPGALSIPVVGKFIWQAMYLPTMPDNQASDFLHPEHFPGWADRYRPQMKYAGFGRALLRSSITLSRTNMDSLYAGVARAGVPTLLVWGKQDQTVTFALSDVVRRNIPTVEFLPVDSSGHLPILEQSPLVHSRILAFLAAHPTP